VAVLPLGEAAYTVRLGSAATVENAERAAALAEAVRHAAIDGITEVVPSVASVTVYFEVGGAGGGGRRERIEHALRLLLAHTSHSPLPPPHSLLHTVPTRYEGADLAEVAARTGLSPDDVIARHTAREYHVLALGFLPGWAYLGPLDPALKLPRRDTPRTRIPAGAVAIAGLQTGVYPRVSPGGWHLIGSTDVVLFDAHRERSALFRAGDRVRFVRIP
jgi:KipI family sensor histidine kinase inhibitor